MACLKPFTFNIIEDTPRFVDVFKDIRRKFGRPYEYLISMVEKSRGGVFAPILLRYCPVKEMDGKIVFLFKTTSIRVFESEVDRFCFSFREGMSASEFHSAYDCSAVALGDYSFWEAVSEETPQENGQAKIMLSTLIPLLRCQPELHLLVIGSSSENTINAGRSYDTLIDYLSTAGYHGTMLLIDPYERETEYESGGFRIKSERRKYDYNGEPLLSPSGDRFTHVYDDVWVPTLTADAHDDIDYTSINVSLADGPSKFAYRIDGSTLVLKSGLAHHKDMPGAIGGGYMTKTGRMITISGTSTGVGPYRASYVVDALKEYHVNFIPVKYKRGRLTFDPNANLFKHYPDARISTKYFGEDYVKPEDTRIMDQTWYRGLEKRLVTNTPVMQPLSRVGCGCDHCAYYDVILSNFFVHNDVDKDMILYGMLSRVIRDKCCARYGATFNNVCGRWVTAARLYATYEQALQSIVQGCAVSHAVAERAYRYLRNNNKISVRGCKVYAHPYKNYTLIRDDYNPTRYYNPRDKDAGYIVRVARGYKVYDAYDRDITMHLTDKLLDYRPSDIDSGCDDVINYFVDKYRSLFSYVDGYQFDLSGRRPCGFDLSFYYAVVRDYRSYIPIEIYRGWALVRTK